MKTTSYGVLIFNERGQLLMAHATGQKHWDIPKGGADEGESPSQSALRELREETGIELTVNQLQEMEELGLMAYQPRKDLHLFKLTLHTRDCDIRACCCTSFFPHHITGEMMPEADQFKWVTIADIAAHAARSLTVLLLKLPGFEAMRPAGR